MQHDKQALLAACQRISRDMEERPAIRAAGLAALERLVPVALRGTGQSSVIGRFLLGLYNGSEYRFDLTDFRLLDGELFDDCLALLRMDNMPEREVHEYLADGEAVFAELRRRYGNGC
ncbi:conserved hypothetical protein [Pseudomonas sp. OF001]|uniref:DUF7673 family protein n=1 Tax=Pseudomonas sp. OF001 TaxID=2772300 RepID=UPI00191A1FCD|nr:hypothetical protein [Pseudomonas sp. OF001]CAD5378987.1 conserved hypothetical protein [Pseudomonas sp. OF001]